MRSSLRVVVCALVMLVAVPQPAHAIWRWLEHMSGPGWYTGSAWNSQQDSCKYPKKKGEKTLEEVLEVSAPCRQDKKKPDQDYSQPREQTAGLSAGLMWSTINRLRYEPSVPPEDTQVWIATGGAFYDYRLKGLLERVEVGASSELFVFFGKATRSMARVSFEPRATISLGTIYSEHQTDRTPVVSLKLRIGVLWLPGEFEPEDFGAISVGPSGGSLEEEILMSSVSWPTSSAGPGKEC